MSTQPLDRPAPKVGAPPSPPTHRLQPRAIVAGVVFLSIIGLAIWYLARPEPLLVQGEVESTRIDIAARVSGRLAKLAVSRGQDVAAGATLLVIDNPELGAELREAEAEKLVADAELARINVGTRAEIVAERKAEIDRATADLTLAQQTYNRTRQLAADKFDPQSKLDQDSDALTLAQQRLNQANLAYQEAVTGFTREEHEIAEATVGKTVAKIEPVPALVDQLTIVAPVASQVYQIPVEEGEVVIPGVPLLSLVDLNDTWLGFSLREDLTAGLKVGDRFAVRIPALGDRQITAEVRVIATKGEYAGWQATRATGDFDLRTFAIRAYPIEKVEGLRPGMSVYTNETAATPEPPAGRDARDTVLSPGSCWPVPDCRSPADRLCDPRLDIQQRGRSGARRDDRRHGPFRDLKQRHPGDCGGTGPAYYPTRRQLNGRDPSDPFRRGHRRGLYPAKF
jgi:HlyD family secretion protein